MGFFMNDNLFLKKVLPDDQKTFKLVWGQQISMKF
jgi:hypothetical protein